MIWRDEALEVQQCSPPEYPDFEFDGPFRKPGAGMLVLIHRYFDKPALNDCWMIGNKPEDEQASEAFGCNFITADILRSRYLPGFHQLSVDVLGLEFLEPSLKGMYRV
jgi:histidinol phosphatase-like enzyme